MAQYKPKSFWQKPEGVTGSIVLGGLLLGAGWIISNSIAAIVAFTSTTLGLVISLLVLGLLIFMALDPKARALVSYMYKSTMRWITSLFIKIDPIAILHGYIQDLKDNLKSMTRNDFLHGSIIVNFLKTGIKGFYQLFRVFGLF